MNTQQKPWNLHQEQPDWNGFDGTVQSPSNASIAESDGSIDSDSDLLSLFEQPVSPYYSRKEHFDRGGRPFPYTRSKTRWRKRPSDEIKYLRGQLVELQKLKAALTNPDTKLFHLNDPLDNHTDKKLSAAQAENRNLRSMVAARFQVVKALQDAIDEHVRLKAQKVDGTVVPAELLFV
ncbi:hypothetical protein F444_08792 [Phytophthora nicotianae P1976]|uniref:Uncharacterized protein n=1 Tax=Phytophthora nicotianae P1976 TaxID=1317066 RepID=A0A081A9V0_PHYNI|nr:hypothetical protein F444_08792 [Phytophthora nicotianae P1976]